MAVSSFYNASQGLVITDKVKSTAAMLTIMSYIGFNHHYDKLSNGKRARATRSTVLDLLSLSKSKFSIVKELIRRMITLVGPAYPFCHSVNDYNRGTFKDYQTTYKMRVCLCNVGVTYINPKSVCCANGLRSKTGDESGLLTLWVYELAVNGGILRVREKKFKVCKPGMVDEHYFLKVGRQGTPIVDLGWQDMNHTYITNVRQTLNPDDFVNLYNTGKVQLMLKLF